MNSAFTERIYLIYFRVQNVILTQLNSFLMLNLIATLNSNPIGFMVLKLKGLYNPQYMGSSTSFNISFM